MADTFIGFLKELGDRLSNPVTSTFVIAFSIWNWPVVIALFAGKIDSPALRIMALEDALANTGYECRWLPLLVFPIVTTAIYLAGMPYLKRIATTHINRRIIEGNRNQEQDFIRIVGEMRNYENIIGFAHQEIQGAFGALNSAIDRYTSTLDSIKLDDHSTQQITAIRRDAQDKLRHLEGVKEKFLGYYLLIQRKNSGDKLPKV